MEFPFSPQGIEAMEISIPRSFLPISAAALAPQHVFVYIFVRHATPLPQVMKRGNIDEGFPKAVEYLLDKNAKVRLGSKTNKIQFEKSCSYSWQHTTRNTLTHWKFDFY